MFKKMKLPHTYVIIFYIIVISAVLTWFVPGGSYERVIQTSADGHSREVIDPNSFEYQDNEPQTWQIFSAIFDGFVRQSGIIVFILLIGGAFWIMNASKAIDVAVYSFLKFTKKVEHIKLFKALGVNNIIMTMIMLVFSTFGAVFGMAEETIAFTIIFVPLAISMGYDSIVGVAICFVAAGLGFAGAMLNPFTIGIAQGLSDVPLFSGIEYRFFCWIVINIVGITWVLRYAAKIKKNPKKSLVYEEDAVWREKAAEDVDSVQYETPKSAYITWIFLSVIMLLYSWDFSTGGIRISTLSVGNSQTDVYIIPIATALFIITSYFMLRKSAHFFVLNLLIFTIVYLIIGVMGYGWYIMEIATLFFVMGIASGAAMNYSPNKIVKLFNSGVVDIMGAAMVVALAGGIIVILENGQIVDTMLYSLSEGMKDVNKVGSVSIMYGIQTLINIIIPSGSAKAALTMPIMAPFSDLIDISRQTTIMAFQFGDGFTNMITPTSGVLIGVLGVARVPYAKWVKWITPFMIVLMILGLLLLIPPAIPETLGIQLNGF